MTQSAKSVIAFKRAVDLDIFSLMPGSPQYAGHFMYMGDSDETGDPMHMFKHYNTRRYTCVPATGEVTRAERFKLQDAAKLAAA